MWKVIREQKVMFNSHEKTSHPKLVVVYQVGDTIFEVVSIEVWFIIQTTYEGRQTTGLELQIMIPLITNIHRVEVDKI